MKTINSTPKILGKYEVKDKIGEGSFGDIYSGC